MNEVGTAQMTAARPEGGGAGSNMMWRLYRKTRPGVPHEQFANEFFRATAAACGAEAACIWIIAGAGAIQPVFRWNLEILGFPVDSEQFRTLAQSAMKVGGGSKPCVISPQAGRLDGEQKEFKNPSEYETILVPLASDFGQSAVVQIFRTPSKDAQEATARTQKLQQVCVFAGDYLRGNELRNRVVTQQATGKLDAVARRLHASLDPREIAYRLTNDGRTVIGCDRLSVAVGRGRRVRIESVSGQEAINYRSNLIHGLTELSEDVLRSGRRLIWSGGEVREAGEGVVVRDGDIYLQESAPHSLVIIPLAAPDAQENGADVQSTKPPLGVVIVEQFSAEPEAETLAKRAELLAAHAVVAFENALAHQQIFLLPLWRWLGRTRRELTASKLAKWTLVLGVIAAIVAALMLVPKELRLKGEGELRAAVRQGIFAAENGVVREVLVDHGDEVTAGQPVAQLENLDLEMQLQELQAQYVETAESIAAREVERESRSLTAQRRIRLAGELAELQQRQQDYSQRIELVKDRIADLTVTAPMGGVITTWEPAKTLRHRPVNRGDRLLFQVDADEEWVLEVDVPEDRIGYLLDYRADLPAEERIEVEYILATHPRERYRGWVKKVSRRTDVADGEHLVRVTVALDPNKLPPLRDGAEVTAKFESGTRSVGFVWFRELVEFVQTRLLF